MAVSTLDDLKPRAMRSFYSKVDKRGPNECWPWTGYTHVGYGRIFTQGTTVKATHLALILAGKNRPDDACALHSCDNPPCCNPAHLRWGTRAENNEDRDSRRRLEPHKGDKHGMAKLTEADARDILASSEKTRVLADRYNVNKDTITNIKSGRTWKHLSA
jgi:hypothetical protein